MEKDYAGLVDEALFECDLDQDLSARVVDVKVSDDDVLCTIQCATMPNDAQLKLFLNEMASDIGTECNVTVIDRVLARFVIKIGRKTCNP
jgi:hypothetical protein